jgi:formiminoglutamase
MESVKLFTSNELAKLTNHRSGEVKFGEKVQIAISNEKIVDQLKNSSARFVLIGIAEDLGVRANLGRPGTATAFQNTLKSLLNVQHNKFCKGSDLFILGEINVDPLMKEAENLDTSKKEDRKKLFHLVSKIDKEVSHTLHQIISTGKIPIIIGGGHNNAYGNIKGLALAKGKPVNAINFDAHSDFRMMEGRHSGNGFSYAFEEGFLKNYFIFGLHESYTSKILFNTLKELNERVKFNTYEEIEVRKTKNFTEELSQAFSFIKSDFYGIELDLDAIPGVPSSAMTFSGFSVQQAREFVHFFGKHKNASYLHICEGAPDLDLTLNNHLTGKLIAYLITDFMKSKTM